MSRDLAAARTVEEVAGAVSRHVEEIFHGPAEVLLPGARRTAVVARDGLARGASGDGGGSVGLRSPASWRGWVPTPCPARPAVYVPLQGSQATVGVLGVRPADSLLPLGPEQVDLLDTLARQAASGLERVRLGREAEEARLAAETERLRSTLLSSVSHDLRTPLATITGAASTLLQPGTLGAEAERELKEAIYEEADRLNRLVTNLLDMTRLESGSLQLGKDWQSLEELVGTALGTAEAGARGTKRSTVRIPADLPLVSVDGLLIEQVFVNLLDNAAKYAEPDSPISVTATAAAGARSRSRWRTRGPGFRRERRSRSSRSSTGRAEAAADPAWACPSAGRS